MLRRSIARLLPPIRVTPSGTLARSESSGDALVRVSRLGLGLLLSIVVAAAFALAGCADRSDGGKTAATPKPAETDAAARSREPGKPTGERRVALVIGNARYPVIALNNPENDARVVGRTLRGLGFEVTEHVNLPVKKFRQVLREYVRVLQNEDSVAVFFYAGHGVQIDGRNYLLPIDINLRDEEEIKDEAVDIEELFMSKLERARARGLIVILDACRDNPFRGKTRNIRSAGGLAEMGARGALIAYSAAPGATAEDGPEGSNSVFTRHLVHEMLEPAVEVETMFKSVRVKVLRDTEMRQMPWVNSSLTVDFQFNPQQVPSSAESERQAELRRLQELLDRREQQQRELEAKLQAIEHRLGERVIDTSAVSPIGTANPIARPLPAEGAKPSMPEGDAVAIAPVVAPSKSPPASAAAGGGDVSPATQGDVRKTEPVDVMALPKGSSPKATPGPMPGGPVGGVRTKNGEAREPVAVAEPRKALAAVPRSEKAGGTKRTDSERCVSLQIRAQLGEPVSTDDLQRECKK